MASFGQLFARLDQSTRTSEKEAALVAYFEEAAPADAVWATFWLAGRRLPAPVKTSFLRDWLAQVTGLPDWLVKESYERVGDLAETFALLLPEGPGRLDDFGLACLIEERVLPLRDWEAPVAFQIVRETWAQLDRPSNFLYGKFLTGALRVGVSRRLTLRALARVAGVGAATMEQRLAGQWIPQATLWERWMAAEGFHEADIGQPYPFMLAHPLESAPEALGELRDWAAEWKYDGMRAQLIKRRGQFYLWSRGQEMLQARFPEICTAAAQLPDGAVLDGELLCARGAQWLPFSALQTRMNRKRLDAKVLLEAPAAYVAFDCLEAQGQDLRTQPWKVRQCALREVVGPHQGDALRLPQAPDAGSWEGLARLREESRQRGVEGIMLKHRGSSYEAGRVRGAWWKWKVEPYAIDAVLLYAQAGHGRRAGLYTDYTLAVWDGDQLVPFAKAYSGLTDVEIKEVDRWIRQHTTAKRGPVRLVEPQLVFEVHFEGIAPSTRHKCGLAVRFPRIARWRKDKAPHEADHRHMLQALASL